jgi:allophanate hydrolase
MTLTTVTGTDIIELVVVGAHLRGLPLNPELVALGAIYLRTVDTAPLYRLFALPGTVPPKPGLLRVAEGGQAIETEVWSMTAAAFGTFVSRIPSPLCIGTLQLADGSTAKGFLVEAVALAGAEDISSYGGWRRYRKAASSVPA